MPPPTRPPASQGSRRHQASTSTPYSRPTTTATPPSTQSTKPKPAKPLDQLPSGTSFNSIMGTISSNEVNLNGEGKKKKKKKKRSKSNGSTTGTDTLGEPTPSPSIPPPQPKILKQLVESKPNTEVVPPLITTTETADDIMKRFMSISASTPSHPTQTSSPGKEKKRDPKYLGLTKAQIAQKREDHIKVQTLQRQMARMREEREKEVEGLMKRIKGLEKDVEGLKKSAGETAKVIEVQERLKETLKEGVTCSVCFETYSDPHILSCGHIACKGCLKTWFHTAGAYAHEVPDPLPPDMDTSHRTKLCHVCRSHITRRPARMYHLRHILEPLGIDSHIPTASQEAAAAEDAWKGLFPLERQGYRLRDDMDGVNRCLECFAEVIGGDCEGCGVEYSDDENEDDDLDDDGFWGIDGDSEGEGEGLDQDGAMDQDDNDMASGEDSGIDGSEIDRVMDELIAHGDIPTDDEEPRRRRRDDPARVRHRLAAGAELDGPTGRDQGAVAGRRERRPAARRDINRRDRERVNHPMMMMFDFMAEESDDGDGIGHLEGANAYHSGSEAPLGEHGDYQGGYDEDDDEESELASDNESYEDSFIDDDEVEGKDEEGDTTGAAAGSEVDELDDEDEDDEEVPRITIDVIRARGAERRIENGNAEERDSPEIARPSQRRRRAARIVSDSE